MPLTMEVTVVRANKDILPTGYAFEYDHGDRINIAIYDESGNVKSYKLDPEAKTIEPVQPFLWKAAS